MESAHARHQRAWANTAETRTLNCCHIDHFPFRCLGCGRTRWGADHLCQLVTMSRSSVTSTWHSRDSDKPLHLHNLVMPLLRNLQTLLTAEDLGDFFAMCNSNTKQQTFFPSTDYTKNKIRFQKMSRNGETKRIRTLGGTPRHAFDLMHLPLL